MTGVSIKSIDRVPVDVLGGVVVLSTTSNIDLTSTGQTALYTVPTGKSCIITEVYIGYTSGSDFISAPTLGVGITASFSETVSNQYPW